MSAQINLYNPALRARRPPLSAARLSLGLLVVVCGVALAYVYYLFQVNLLTQEAAQVEAQLQARQTQLAELGERGQARKLSRRTQAELAEAETRVQGRELIARAMGLGLSEPGSGFAETLRALARERVPGVWLTEIRLADSGGAMSLRGRALEAAEVARLIRQLGNQPALKGRSFVALEIKPVPLPDATAGDAAGGERKEPAAAIGVDFVLEAAGPAGATDAAAPQPVVATAGRERDATRAAP